MPSGSRPASSTHVVLSSPRMHAASQPTSQPCCGAQPADVYPSGGTRITIKLGIAIKLGMIACLPGSGCQNHAPQNRTCTPPAARGWPSTGHCLPAWTAGNMRQATTPVPLQLRVDGLHLGRHVLRTVRQLLNQICTQGRPHANSSHCVRATLAPCIVLGQPVESQSGVDRIGAHVVDASGVTHIN